MKIPKSRKQLVQRAEIEVYEHRETKYVKTECLDVELGGWEYTFSLHKNKLKYCTAEHEIDEICVYSLEDSSIEDFGSSGTNHAGQFKRPFICDDDDDGNILLSDRHTTRLQVMNERGQFRLVAFESKRPNVVNGCAVLHDQCLYAICTDGQLVRYVSEK